jgi:hypothetical protein
MTEDTTAVSAQAGSTAPGPAADGGAGKPVDTNPAQNYAELEKRFGSQGEELGEYRKFIENITPLLTKLNDQPELIQAVMDDKIDAKLVGAILEGKVKIEEAQQVAVAHEQVKQEMGPKAFEQASAAEIEKRILDKALETATQAVEQRFKTADDQKEFEDSVTEFIGSTPDFAQFADKIAVWLNEHPDQDDIEVAYDAVKGKVLTDAAVKADQKTVGELAKEVAANAGGGTAPSSGQVNPETDIWDKLVSKRGNPNSL